MMLLLQDVSTTLWHFLVFAFIGFLPWTICHVIIDWLSGNRLTKAPAFIVHFVRQILKYSFFIFAIPLLFAFSAIKIANLFDCRIHSGFATECNVLGIPMGELFWIIGMNYLFFGFWGEIIAGIILSFWIGFELAELLNRKL